MAFCKAHLRKPATLKWVHRMKCWKCLRRRMHKRTQAESSISLLSRQRCRSFFFFYLTSEKMQRKEKDGFTGYGKLKPSSFTLFITLYIPLGVAAPFILPDWQCSLWVELHEHQVLMGLPDSAETSDWLSPWYDCVSFGNLPIRKPSASTDLQNPFT